MAFPVARLRPKLTANVREVFCMARHESVLRAAAPAVHEHAARSYWLQRGADELATLREIASLDEHRLDALFNHALEHRSPMPKR